MRAVTFGGRNLAVILPSTDISSSSLEWVEQLLRNKTPLSSCPSSLIFCFFSGTKHLKNNVGKYHSRPKHLLGFDRQPASPPC